jgi:hypothetical protein
MVWSWMVKEVTASASVPQIRSQPPFHTDSESNVDCGGHDWFSGALAFVLPFFDPNEVTPAQTDQACSAGWIQVRDPEAICSTAPPPNTETRSRPAHDSMNALPAKTTDEQGIARPLRE